MSNTELKAIHAAIRGTRDLIATLNSGREMHDTISEMFFELSRYACILTEMVGED